MSTLFSASVTAGLLAASWSVHALWMRRRIDAARRDPLTGLHTRTAFTRRAARLLRSGPALVVLADVNDFKTVNDTHGHAAGDALLAAVASRMTLFCRSGVTARLGGDEFAAVLPVHPAHAHLALNALHSVICQHITYGEQLLSVSVSAGGAIVTAPARTGIDVVLSSALRRADEAMYTAKRTHGRTHVINLSDGAPAVFESVNGRRAGRAGTHQPNGGSTR